MKSWIRLAKLEHLLNNVRQYQSIDMSYLEFIPRTIKLHRSHPKSIKHARFFLISKPLTRNYTQLTRSTLDSYTERKPEKHMVSTYTLLHATYTLPAYTHLHATYTHILKQTKAKPKTQKKWFQPPCCSIAALSLCGVVHCTSSLMLPDHTRMQLCVCATCTVWAPMVAPPRSLHVQWMVAIEAKQHLFA